MAAPRLESSALERTRRAEEQQLIRVRYMLRRSRTESGMRALRARYGQAFPGFDSRTTNWVAYLNWLWGSQDSAMGDRMFLAEKLKLFRDGDQWISAQDGRWTKPRPPKNVVRQTVNMIGPAQDYRLNVLEEQRPGFVVVPHGNTSEDRDAAEAQQILAEWVYYRRGVLEKLVTAMRFAQDFGVAGLQVVWNTSLGQRREATITRIDADGIERAIPLDERGRELPEGSPPHVYAEGDVDFIPVRGDQVRCDPEALDVSHCRWLQIRRLRPLSELIFEHGDSALGVEAVPYGATLVDSRSGARPVWRRPESYYPEERFGDTPVAEEATLYLAPSDYLPDGLFVVTAGNRLLHIGPLPFGPDCGIPFARFTDGGTLPDFFPRPAAADWLDDQVAINALVSRILQNARLNSGGRLLAYHGSIVKDTYTNTLGSVIEWKGPRPPEWLEASAIGQDTWNALQFHIRMIENKSGWNDVARGQLSPQVPESGRGILAIREQFERGLQPFIRAAARGMADAFTLAIKVAAWGYIRPRLVPIVGEDRPDLVRFITQADLSRQTDVRVDPETLMPMPRALKQQMLREDLELRVIDVQEYRRRSPYANVRNLNTPDDLHYARAKRVNFLLEQTAELIEAGQLLQPPLFWQDNPGIHQQVLQELILDDRKPAAVRRVAASRWDYYALLQLAQQGNPNAQLQVKALIDQLMPGGPLRPPPVPALPLGPLPQAPEPPSPGPEPTSPAGPADPYERAAELAAAQTSSSQFEAQAPQ